MAIERKTLRVQVRDELLSRMREGIVTPGEDINELQLAAELGVSRTPLREALITLHSEGQIESVNGKGFRYVPLSAREFKELAPIMATLEGLALQLTPREKLREIGERLATLAAEFDQESAEHELVATRDDEWHNILVSGCDNTRLHDILANVRVAFHRYESLLVAEKAVIGRVAAEHAVIAKHVTAGDIAQATEALTVNWANGAQRILDSSSNPHLTE
ncbi:GntR family transcriptional regulator [Homoserinimonas sp. OAct 916]|uniref:GntR family transcriptional regulator n=1 Tax=Homoserinimonas sp. OAct 916 TaxID=2211450 RepID=UPI000DBE2DF1|nr:GntR family transcriptional regulator [Homoserinimonas sp. OAct 916]